MLPAKTNSGFRTIENNRPVSNNPPGLSGLLLHQEHAPKSGRLGRHFGGGSLGPSGFPARHAVSVRMSLEWSQIVSWFPL